MNKLYFPDFDLYSTLLGGQSFSWDLEGDEFRGFTSSRYIKLKKDGDFLLWQTYPVTDDYNYLKKYLRLDVNYEDILNQFPKDEHIEKAKEKFKGLRLLSQDFPDTVLGYLASSNKSVKAIRSSVRKMRERYGEVIEVDGEQVKLLPKLEVISEDTIDNLRTTGVGFRARYIYEASGKYKEGFLNNVHELSYSNAKSRLIELSGVGDKVADCILLYSLKHDSVLPLDVWGKRILTNYYGLSQKMKYNEMQKWVGEYFNGVGGWAGQMLFEYIRGFK
ncbi:hypothetical protein HYV12_01775 [Candidatus Dojkabacteria bacterium]|nr:hypothetical protein [Candidatus Dojkabacteria bacterium]